MEFFFAFARLAERAAFVPAEAVEDARGVESQAEFAALGGAGYFPFEVHLLRGRRGFAFVAELSLAVVAECQQRAARHRGGGGGREREHRERTRGEHRACVQSCDLHAFPWTITDEGPSKEASRASVPSRRFPASGVEPLHGPAVAVAAIKEAVVKARRALLPELESLGDDAEAAPVVGDGQLGVRVTLLQPLHLFG